MLLPKQPEMRLLELLPDKPLLEVEYLEIHTALPQRV
jgi:hypothetical protein